MPTIREEYNDQFVGNDWVHYLICRIDPFNDGDLNLAKLLKAGIKKDPLKAVITFIKNNFTEKYGEAINVLAPKKAGATKSELFNQLITFVHTTLPHPCLTCKESYLPYSDINRSDGEDKVSCFICSIPAHKGCIKKEHVNTDVGLVFLCEHCLLHKGKDDAPVDDTSKPPPQQEAIEQDSDSSIKESDDEDSERKLNKVEKKNDKQKSPVVEMKVIEAFNLDTLYAMCPKASYPICEQYRRNNCPHGRKGLDEVDGKLCDKLHPKKCFPWCKAGSNAKHGCTKGRDCPFYHPILCRNSLRYRKCTNPSCTFTHLKFTRRFNQPSEQENVYEEKIHDYSNQHTHHNKSTAVPRENVPHPWDAHNSQETRNLANSRPQSENRSHSDSMAFLVDLIESMKKEMRRANSEMEDFKKDITNQMSSVQEVNQELQDLKKNIVPVHPQIWQQAHALQAQLPSVHSNLQPQTLQTQMFQNQTPSVVNQPSLQHQWVKTN